MERRAVRRAAKCTPNVSASFRDGPKDQTRKLEIPGPR